VKGFLLDTCVVSEPLKRRPNPGVMQWLAAADEDRLHISTITLGEIRKGIERMSDSPSKRRLDEWLALSVLDRFDRRILSIDAVVADVWGRMAARLEMDGTPVAAADALIAATAEAYNLEVVTRNLGHFAPTGVALASPWDE
jgi:toxin FitB